MDPTVALLIIKVLDLIASGLELAPELAARKDRYLTMIRAMIEEDRGPTDAEWDELLAESDSITDQIRRIRDARTPPVPTEG